MNTFLIHIKGLVQGVGFRPFIFRVASEFNLNGEVENRNDGVFIKINCDENSLNNFIQTVRNTAPPASSIESIEFVQTEFINFSDFQIVKSNTVSNRVTEVSPDIAVCDNCLRDMKTQPNRINYPFINCTNCGPRFTIIQDLPYDRDKTTMREFIMCDDCRKEYTDVRDRRFHAQPVACSVCGPEYTLHYDGKTIKGISEILNELGKLFHEKKIIAIKGIGGFFLACDALDEEAVQRLRKLKNREGKPFAVMFSSLQKLKEYAHVDAEEEKSLTSLKRPIVLLTSKKELAPSVCVGFGTVGSMLPYMPLHYLLFEKTNLEAIVLTSGNISDEPIITDNSDALNILTKVADAVVTYNRDIYNRADDSVVTVVNEKERVSRRSRGYAPSPVNLKLNVDGILATGAELVNCFAIGKHDQAILSQHIGDLKNMETYAFYCESLERYKQLFRFEPQMVVSDLHPDYLSTRYAAESRLPHVKVQHHHAHIASCMAENGLNETVIGISFDGTGLGDDNNIWGGEFLICDLNKYKRFSHFGYIPMPGGDKVTDEPWRMAVSYLYRFFGDDFRNKNLPFLSNIKPDTIGMLCQAIDKKINTPLTSSSGRLFDAVAALINLCPVSQFHAEAPMRLESVIDKSVEAFYPFDIKNEISFEPTFRAILHDMEKEVSVSVISAKFHNMLIAAVIEMAIRMKKECGSNKVVLSGGTFQNKYLLGNLERKLASKGFDVISHHRIPTNDGGIALGQLVIAAAQKSK
ncbi:MAG: carbamoyltransferase HypF [Bacteroidetes bacterium GWF2_43_63]|nr:MAG: carbamoyltransferase HypF [Bacteroidetes bacterium GWE2_42_42]OFY53666.1 MAG: carbamoyltransferase HypF [Bacteroidetes bacterium GWF2_43_63]HBG70990.1 carbamoyltransferase HypF [Bacteroidales bacterium]HCB62919.1 carbamoyltransferase HypF [Bacteroidales bacterium]HCY24317.1 carbamoyltransferase HypF [Bacteroidales bacterium]